MSHLLTVFKLPFGTFSGHWESSRSVVDTSTGHNTGPSTRHGGISTEILSFLTHEASLRRRCVHWRLCGCKVYADPSILSQPQYSTVIWNPNFLLLMVDQVWKAFSLKSIDYETIKRVAPKIAALPTMELEAGLLVAACVSQLWHFGRLLPCCRTTNSLYSVHWL